MLQLPPHTIPILLCPLTPMTWISTHNQYHPLTLHTTTHVARNYRQNRRRNGTLNVMPGPALNVITFTSPCLMTNLWQQPPTISPKPIILLLATSSNPQHLQPRNKALKFSLPHRTLQTLASIRHHLFHKSHLTQIVGCKQPRNR